MPHCVRAYAHARIDPFGRLAQGACVPSGDGGRTFKFQTFVNWPFSFAGAGGGKGLLVTWRPSADNDISQLSYAEELSSTTLDAAVAIAHQTCKGSPFAAASFGTGNLEQRLVGAEIRAYPTSSSLKKQGMAIGYWTPTGGYLAGTNSPDALAVELNGKKAFLASDEFLKVTFDHDNTNEMTNWHPASYYFGGATSAYTGGLKAGPVVIWLPGNSDGDIMYNVQCIAHWEVRGRIATPMGHTEQPEPVAFQKAACYASDYLRSAGSSVSEMTGVADKIAEAAASTGRAISAANSLFSMGQYLMGT